VTTALLLAAFLAFAIGIVHSFLGERYILIRYTAWVSTRSSEQWPTSLFGAGRLTQ
jgi:hypothetical protein